MPTAVDRDAVLAGGPTGCRWENRADRQAAAEIHRVLAEQFIASHRQPPAEVILDFDATDDAVHGNREGRFFHGYYDQRCFLPLDVFCGDQVLVSYLRPSGENPTRQVWAILSLLVKRFRQAWPQVKIIFRGDSQMCRRRMMWWCGRHGVGYIGGLAKNRRLKTLAASLIETAAAQYAARREKQRVFGEVIYAAATWDRERRVVVKAEHRGQWDDRVLCRANAGGATMWFTTDGVHYQFTRHISCYSPLSCHSRAGGNPVGPNPPQMIKDNMLAHGDVRQPQIPWADARRSRASPRRVARTFPAAGGAGVRVLV